MEVLLLNWAIVHLLCTCVNPAFSILSKSWNVCLFVCLSLFYSHQSFHMPTLCLLVQLTVIFLTANLLFKLTLNSACELCLERGEASYRQSTFHKVSCFLCRHCLCGTNLLHSLAVAASSNSRGLNGWVMYDTVRYIFVNSFRGFKFNLFVNL